jgi:hypothetical protein
MGPPLTDTVLRRQWGLALQLLNDQHALTIDIRKAVVTTGAGAQRQRHRESRQQSQYNEPAS